MELSGYAYICAAGETFDSIARELYNDEKYAAELMCANPEYSTRILFRGDEVLYLPEIDLPENEDDEEAIAPAKAPWREE